MTRYRKREENLTGMLLYALEHGEIPAKEAKAASEITLGEKAFGRRRRRKR